MLVACRATPECDVLRRDIYDRPPVFKWTKGNVILLGDSAHAMQPNLGQGGCMAIEDAFQLAKDLYLETTDFKEPWFKLERILVVSSYAASRGVVTAACRRAWSVHRQIPRLLCAAAAPVCINHCPSCVMLHVV